MGDRGPGQAGGLPGPRPDEQTAQLNYERDKGAAIAVPDLLAYMELRNPSVCFQMCQLRAAGKSGCRLEI